ncbi:element excision factor XisH family protein [Dolichospermum circinale CS-1225]|uniref:Element excision factor XisH family protein n=1 Tax=Dolichospermum circinale CS-537/01 TaxID=3021739 RepID=A0ABT5A2Q1_9CYAN|nr:element excision factor XisH family protein [Dolichospermum circinale]MDB9482625.1 element excision factor XisH family protein [Dolichospermum circinale CS-537/05]MDB9475906.1 element excision factor XisH family protein [Dolichospermum circinale CS-537/11]MDB9479464.1 element excision factor XisH family protein [Dolichospermum circinale CS-537/03]MDB9486196.1 element excision factor XisH family protein [Dolichospermum circinale CS-537/01]MDB9490300.1 element excision factor XisH family prot
MPAKDLFHNTVKTALTKDGWTIDVYNEFFSRKFIQRIIGEYDLKLLIFNPDQEEIVIWRD